MVKKDQSKKISSIRTRRTFETLFKKGRPAKGKFLNVWVLKGFASGPEVQLGLVVSRRTHRLATRRNLWKRRIREAFRAQQENLTPGVAVVVLAKQNKTAPSLMEIKEELAALLKKAKA